MVLLLAAVLFALFFILNAIIQIIRQQTRIGFVQTLLAFLVVLLPVAALIENRLSENPLPLIRALALGIAAVVMVPSLILMVLEIRRPERLKQSRGLLGVGVALLLLLATFGVPLIADYTFAPVQPTTTPIIILAGSSPEDTVEAGLTHAPSTPTRTPAPTHRPPPTPTPTATRFQFVTRTPQPTATLPNPCLALANYNVNVRAKPEMDAELLATIPYNSTVTLYGRNADSSWWYGEYEGKAGWMKGEFLSVSASCKDLPEKAVQ